MHGMCCCSYASEQDVNDKFHFGGRTSGDDGAAKGDKAEVLRSSQLTLVQDKIRARRAGVAGPKPACISYSQTVYWFFWGWGGAVLYQ